MTSAKLLLQRGKLGEVHIGGIEDALTCCPATIAGIGKSTVDGFAYYSRYRDATLAGRRHDAAMMFVVEQDPKAMLHASHDHILGRDSARPFRHFRISEVGVCDVWIG